MASIENSEFYFGGKNWKPQSPWIVVSVTHINGSGEFHVIRKRYLDGTK